MQSRFTNDTERYYFDSMRELSQYISDTKRRWRIKGADQPLDLAVLAFAIGHPAMFRRLGFALRERVLAPEQRSYGATLEATVSDLINAPAGAIVLNGMRHAGAVAPTPEAALEYITRQIEQAQGGSEG